MQISNFLKSCLKIKKKLLFQRTKFGYCEKILLECFSIWLILKCQKLIFFSELISGVTFCYFKKYYIFCIDNWKKCHWFFILSQLYYYMRTFVKWGTRIKHMHLYKYSYNRNINTKPDEVRVFDIYKMKRLNAYCTKAKFRSNAHHFATKQKKFQIQKTHRKFVIILNKKWNQPLTRKGYPNNPTVH